MSYDDFDDGLVHGHGWATDAPAPVPTQRRERVVYTHGAVDHDDGLVHGHAWAMGSES